MRAAPEPKRKGAEIISMLVAEAPRPQRRRVSPKLALGAAAVALSMPALAWEADVHYGLTKWIALRVGYPEPQAEWIARGDQGVDDSWVTGPVIGTLLAACTGSDPSGSVTVHNNHFPSPKNPPNSAAERVVKAGASWRDGSPRQPPRLDATEATHSALGQYLHTLQDTWSHQGEPDVPQFCQNQLGWGHATKRGGWSCHLADLTYRWNTTDVPKMAKATYDTLVLGRGGKAAVPWQALAHKSGEFAFAKTKWQKDEWFKREGFTDRRFLQGLSLPDCESGARSCVPYPFKTLLERWKQINDAARLEAKNLPPEITRLFESFFNAMVNQSLATLQKELIDENLAEIALARALHIDGSCPPLYAATFSSALGRAFADGRGGHQPLAVCELAAQLDSTKSNGISCAAAADAATKAVEAAAPRGPGLAALVEKVRPLRPFVYSVWPGQTPEGYWAFARFVHLPRDKLAVSAAPVNGRLKITSFIWLPNE